MVTLFLTERISDSVSASSIRSTKLTGLVLAPLWEKFKATIRRYPKIVSDGACFVTVLSDLFEDFPSLLILIVQAGEGCVGVFNQLNAASHMRQTRMIVEEMFDYVLALHEGVAFGDVFAE